MGVDINQVAPATLSRPGAHYRCKVLAEYAAANVIDHPKSVYVREDRILPHLDRWLGQVFDPTNIDDTMAALEEAATSLSAADGASIDAARRAVADFDDRLRKHRAALEAGADPAIVSGWIARCRPTASLPSEPLRPPRPRLPSSVPTTSHG